MKKFFLLFALFMFSLACFSQQKIYLKVGNIKGESTDGIHKDWIDAYAFSGGASNSGTMHLGGGGGAGKANIQDYSLTICLDKAVNELRAAVQKGTRIDKVEIDITKNALNKEVVYLKVLMEDVIISSISEGGSIGEDKFTLNVSFNFARYRNTYTPIGKDGQPGPSMTSGWSIAENSSY